ncbi:hypothetical protein J6590_007659 [Homalodisca vitripennis]|nr:hypothetical protein J6590_007659 [Homalodisca vitripennis]
MWSGGCTCAGSGTFPFQTGLVSLSWPALTFYTGITQAEVSMTVSPCRGFHIQENTIGENLDRFVWKGTAYEDPPPESRGNSSSVNSDLSKPAEKWI